MPDSNLEEQRALYGSTLAERFGAVLQAYGLNQRGLAQVLGISAPMLSQLIGGTRIKIGNPAVYERLVMLEMRAGECDLATVLEEVRDSHPVLTGQTSTRIPTVDVLPQLATTEQFLDVADYARSRGATRLADALEEAALAHSSP